MFVLPLRAGLTFVNGLKSLNKINGPKINATIAKDKPPPNYIFSSSYRIIVNKNVFKH
jgi:hypothetical protein